MRNHNYVSIRLIVFLTLFISFPITAYKPVFMQYPATIWKDGFGLEFDIQITKSELLARVGVLTQILYGFTRDLEFALDIPVTGVAREYINDPPFIRESAGIGDVEGRLKYRLYQRLEIAKLIELSVIGGVRLPFANPTEVPSLGNDTVSVVGYLTGSYNSRCFYLFGTTGGRFMAKNGPERPGHEFYFSLAMGPRPLRLDFNSPDFVFLPELDIIHTFKRVQNCQCVRDSATTIAFVGPAFLWSLKNMNVKFGLQWPIGHTDICCDANDTASSEPHTDLRVTLAIGAQF